MEDEAASRAYLLQVWAEAMALYRSGQYSMKFSKEIQAQFLDIQKDFMQEDTDAGIILEFLDRYKGDKVCCKQLYREALHQYDEPKKWQLHDIGEIMRSYATDWCYFKNPRSFGGEYGRQKGWERVPTGNEPPATSDGFRELTEEEAEQLELPKEWLA